MGVVKNTTLWEDIMRRRKDSTTEHDDMCVYCKLGTVLLSGDAVLCSRRGLVKPTAKCRKFAFDPLKHDIKPLPPMPKLYFPSDDSTDLF